MKTAYKLGTDVFLRDVPLRPLRQDEILLDVAACGICGTDLQLNSDSAGTEAGFGHEIAGTIRQLGSAVTHLEVGQKVALESATACGQCTNCRNARQELCTDIRSFFFLQSFGFAEQMIAPAVSAIPCPDLAPEIACLSEPLGVAIDMVRLADIRPDSNVLVMGPGPIGLMSLALARRMGARRVFMSAFARNTARVELAKAFGADAVLHPEQTPLEHAEFGCAIDRCLVTTPPPTLAEAFAVCAKGGVVSFIGIDHGKGAFCRFDANAFHFKKLQLKASFASPALYTPLALQYLREGVVDAAPIVSHTFPLARITEAMDTARDHAASVKVVVTP